MERRVWKPLIRPKLKFIPIERMQYPIRTLFGFLQQGAAIEAAQMKQQEHGLQG